MAIATSFAGSRLTRFAKRTSIPAYITATGADNTATVNGPAINNRSGNIRQLNYVVAVSAATGTTPQLALALQQSLDEGTTWYPVLNTSGSAIATSATTISANSTVALSTANSGLTRLPSGLYRVVETLSGTTPTRNSVSSVTFYHDVNPGTL